MKIPNSKRLRITMFAFAANMIVLCFGIAMASNITEVGTGLVMVDTLIFGYIWGETSRPSENK